MSDLNLGLAETGELSRFYVPSSFQRTRQLNCDPKLFELFESLYP